MEILFIQLSDDVQVSFLKKRTLMTGFVDQGHTCLLFGGVQLYYGLKPAKLQYAEEEGVIAASGVKMAAHASELEIAKKNLTDAIGDNVKQ